ncbi:hypothetical protein RB200_10230 [Streptomyces sp. PmtG]
MTQGAGQGPEVRTATLRDFRVPAYVYEGVRETGNHPAEQGADDRARGAERAHGTRGRSRRHDRSRTPGIRSAPPGVRPTPPRVRSGAPGVPLGAP